MEQKSRFNIGDLFSGRNTREKLENWSFLVTIVSGFLIALGIGLGAFVNGSILIASLGSFTFMVGIGIFILSQFFEEGV